MKRLRFILLLTIFFIPSIVFADNLTPTVDPSKKIYDFAEELTEEQEGELLEKVDLFIDKYNMDMVLVIINKNPYGVSDYYTEQYADDFYDYNNFGKGTTHDGILFLIDLDNRYPYISTTGEGIKLYDDSRIENMHDAAYNYLADGNYYAAFNAYVNMATSYASDGVPSSNEHMHIDDNGVPHIDKPKSVNWGITTLVAFALSFFPIFIHTRKYRGIKLATNAETYLEKVEKGANVDQFLTTFTSKTRIHHNDDSSSGHGGGMIGGSSIHFGSSGRSHGGGGGRHF